MNLLTLYPAGFIDKSSIDASGARYNASDGVLEPVQSQQHAGDHGHLYHEDSIVLVSKRVMTCFELDLQQAFDTSRDHRHLGEVDVLSVSSL